MDKAVELARRGYHGAQRFLRLIGAMPPDPNPFPVDAWTDPAYDSWFQAHRATASELDRQRVAQEKLAYRPVFSFIVPLYKTPLDYLDAMAASVLAQTYPRLQLVLINASPELPELAAAVNELAVRDSRVAVVPLEANKGIAENTNAGIDAAAGDFYCFLDHDDAIEPNLLFEYAAALNEDQEIDVLYCDEDLVAYDARRKAFRHLHALFKPAYSPELMLCKNAVVHLMCIRRSLVDSMPAPDARYDGAQDYNMVMRCCAMARRVRGVQKVLYHWRVSEGSTAANPDAKVYGRKASRLSAQEELARRTSKGRIVASGLVNIHNIWFSRMNVGRVSVVVDAAPWTDEAVQSESRACSTIARFREYFVQNNSLEDVEVLLVGGGPDVCGPVAPFVGVEAEPGADVVGRLNMGAARATGDYLVFLDAGCFFETAEPLEQLTGLCALDGVGVAAPKTLYRNGRNKSYGVAVTSEGVLPLHRGHEDAFPGYQCNTRAFQNASACGLQGLTISRRLFEDVGGFDGSFGGELAAVDLCKRVRDAGMRVALTCTVKLRTDDECPKHYFVATENAPDYTKEDIARYDKKWPGARAEGDPYYSPNFNQANGYCQVGI